MVKMKNQNLSLLSSVGCANKPISMVSYPHIPGPHRLRGTVETFLIKK